MIRIEERIPSKLPGLSSLFISFDFKREIVDIIKTTASVMNYDKKTFTWEVPVTDLSNLLDRLCTIDDISLKFLETKEITDKVYELEDYQTKPFDYQLDAIQYGLNHDKWLLLDAPGLGKTLVLTYLAQELKHRYNVEHCLVICGINSLKTNWAKEIKKHSNMTCRILGQRITRKGKQRVGGNKERLEDLKAPIEEFFVITNIETIRNKEIVAAINKGPNKFDIIYVDEIHKAKSATSKQGEGLLKLTKAKYKVGATGTLIMNDPVDCYTPLKFIEHNNSTHSNFEHYYYVYGGPFGTDLLGYRNIDILKDHLSACSLRRSKDLLNLPPKTIINEYIDMNDEQYEFYNSIKDGIIDQVDLVHMSVTNLLAMITRLRQATSYPDILSSEGIKSSKIERAEDLAKEIIDNGSKVVIFSTFKQPLSKLYEDLKAYNPTLNTGDTEDNTVSNNVDRFQTDSDNKIFLATWQKMGTGITLTAADYAIFLDTPWTNAEYVQCQDRIYRIGTDKPVFIYNLICNGTIDERVLELVEDKEAISDYIVDDKITQKSINSLKKYIEELSKV